MKRRWSEALLAVCFAPLAAPAGPDIRQELQNDVVLRALVDELQRSMPGLKLEDLERPYFIEYGLTDTARASVSAELGAVTSRNENRSRSLRSDVRVGSYQLDNTNFQGGGYGGYFGFEFGGLFGASLPIEDDYNAIRQAIWWTTDRDYKEVVETLVQKKAFMESKLIQDKPDDFSHESPTVYCEDRAPLTLELARLEELAVALSAIFRDFPAVQNSSVSVNGCTGNKYLVNTEGTRLRTARRRFSVSVNATVQADDGMKLSDSLSVYARQLAELPPRDELIRRCRALAGRLVALQSAPTLGTYTGPVLFDAEAAASLFARQFGALFAGGQRPVGSRTSADDFANKLNKRILPRFLNVVDDPGQEIIAGVPVTGRYVYDDQGVKVQAVSLVEAGRLKALLMSRNPSKEFKQSNGHGRGAYTGVRTTVGCLLVTAEQADNAATLKQKLLNACADEDLEFGLRVAALGGTSDTGYRSYGSYGGFDMSEFAGRGTGGATTPLAMYKVYPDGREELVRGAEIARFDLKAFKRMLAAGDTPYVLNTIGSGSEGQTIVAPALLFEELDLAKIDRDFDKPPILPTPLARQ
jgi:hypothetical protein